MARTQSDADLERSLIAAGMRKAKRTFARLDLMRPSQLGDIDRADQWTIKTVPHRMHSLTADHWMISTARAKGSRPRCDVQLVRAELEWFAFTLASQLD